MRKPFFAYAKTNTQISCAVTAQLFNAFVFATQIVQSLFFINPNFQGSNHLLLLYSLVCVGPSREHKRPVFSQRDSYLTVQGHSSQSKHVPLRMKNDKNKLFPKFHTLFIIETRDE